MKEIVQLIVGTAIVVATAKVTYTVTDAGINKANSILDDVKAKRKAKKEASKKEETKEEEK